MRIVLRVTSSNEHCNRGCEFAHVDLTPELGALALRRIATLRQPKALDPDLDEVYYWANGLASYFDSWAESSIEDKEAEDMGVAVEEMLAELEIQQKEVVRIPESFVVIPSQSAAVECEQMIVQRDSIAFTAIPKHASFRVETAEVPLTMLEAAAAAPHASPVSR